MQWCFGEYVYFGERIEDELYGVDVFDFGQEDFVGVVEFYFGWMEKGVFGFVFEFCFYCGEFEEVD